MKEHTRLVRTRRHAGRKGGEGTPLVAVALTFVGGTLGYFVAQIALYSQPHGYHLLGMPIGALLGWLVGQSIYRLRRRHSP